MEKPKLIKRITRKQIAVLIDLNVRQLVRREPKLGLGKCRLPRNGGCEIEYNESLVLAALRERGLIE